MWDIVYITFKTTKIGLLTLCQYNNVKQWLIKFLFKWLGFWCLSPTIIIIKKKTNFYPIVNVWFEIVARNSDDPVLVRFNSVPEKSCFEKLFERADINGVVVIFRKIQLVVDLQHEIRRLFHLVLLSRVDTLKAKN